MPRITVTASDVRVDLPLTDKILTFHGSLTIPREHIASAHVENENGWQHMWSKLVGVDAPGLKMGGTFFMNGGLAFLDYGSGRNCLVLETTHETYGTIIVQPDADQDAAALAKEINGANSADR